ncbi:MAG TPA: tetratricopeptide repeat protein, partial [Urbifossiella sp.]
CLEDQSELAEAETVLDALLKKESNHPEALVERARVAFRRGQAQAGEKFARRVIDGYPQAADPHLVLAHCLEAQGEKAEAIQEQKRWQSLDSAQYHLNLIMPQLGRTPDDVRWNYQAGSCLWQMGNAEMAAEAFETALRSDPGHRPSHRLLAECYTRMGEFERAKKHQRAAR